MPFAEVNGVSLYYETAGSGPSVLFVGGTGGDLRQRPSVLEGPLARRHTVLAYDQRGLGRSEKRDEAVGMGDFAEDAAALVAHIGLERVAVVGVSFGGMVAQELAIRHPQLVDRLVLCCTSSGGAGGSSYPLHDLAGLPEDERLRASLAISDVRNDRAWQEAHPNETTAILEVMRVRASVGGGEEGVEAGARRQLEARRAHDTWDRLGAIGCPTLVCAGRYDAIAPVANSEAIVSRIEGARLEVFNGGHLFLLQDRRAWDVIIDFLS